MVFDTQVLLETDQIPIEVEDGGHGDDHLALELKIGHFHVVARYADIAAVNGLTEALQ